MRVQFWVDSLYAIGRRWVGFESDATADDYDDDKDDVIWHGMMLTLSPHGIDAYEDTDHNNNDDYGDNDDMIWTYIYMFMCNKVMCIVMIMALMVMMMMMMMMTPAASLPPHHPK